MKHFSFVILCFLLLLSASVYSQDTVQVIDDALALIQKSQYASAHQLLMSTLQETGLRPELVCLLVENALRHYVHQRDYQIFYLSDVRTSSRSSSEAHGMTNLVRVWHPERLLQKLLGQNPDYGPGWKLMGDFYRLQIEAVQNPLLAHPDRLKNLREKVFKCYWQASQLGVNTPTVNRWLGDYYLALNQREEAQNYYQKNVDMEAHDGESYLRLAKLRFDQNQYNQAYLLAEKSLSLFSEGEIWNRYQALVLAAQSVRNLEENERFLKYARQAAQLIPDEKEAHLLLINFYDEQENVAEMEKVFRNILFRNPYERSIYEALEKMVVKYKNYIFAEQVFDEIILKYENFDEVMGNVYWSRGNLLYSQGMFEEARKFWEISKNYFQKFLPETDPIFKQIGNLEQKSTLR